MRIRKIKIFLTVLLIAYFVFAAFMTVLSQREYMRNCIDVVIDTNGMPGSISLYRSCYINMMPDLQGQISFQWDLGSLNGILQIGDRIELYTDKQKLDGEIIEISENGTIPMYTVATNWNRADLSDSSAGVMVSANIKGPMRNYVFPTTYLIQEAGIYKMPVAESRQKVWGTEYYVKYENVKVYELNHEKCAIVSLPASGSIIIGSDGYFTEGSKIKIVQEK